MYNRIWEIFCGFCKSYLTVADLNLPVSITTLSLYLAHLHNKGLASASLSTFLFPGICSALNNMLNFKDKNTSFLKKYMTFFSLLLFLFSINANASKFLLFTDASGVHGYGAVFEKSWFYGSWNEEWLSYNITVTKLYPIVLAVGLWRERLANRSVCFQCDNEALALMLNKKSSKEKNVMYFLRKLVFLSLKFNILFKPNSQNNRIQFCYCYIIT
jgi:hypothetical protein